MKHWAQKSFICYIRSVHLQSNKRVFDVRKLPIAEYANSLGLAQPPRVRFLRRGGNRKRESTSENEERSSSESEGEEQGTPGIQPAVTSEDDEEDVLKVKRVIKPGDWDDKEFETLPKSRSDSKAASSKIALAKKVVHKKLKVNTHIRFGEDGEPVVRGDECPEVEEEKGDVESSSDGLIEPVPIDELSEETKNRLGGIDISESQKMLKSRDKADRKRERERVKLMHVERKEKRRKHKLASSSVQGRATLAALEPKRGSEGSSMTGQPATLVEFSSEEEIEIPAAKRPRTARKKTATRIEQSSGNRKADLLTKDEELALHLLS